MIGMIKRLIYVIFTIPAFICIAVAVVVATPVEMLRIVFIGFREHNESSFVDSWPGYIDGIVTKLKPEK
jgi:hypothetical protein